MAESTSVNITDLEILKKVSGYDSKALEALYNRYSTILYTLIKAIVSEDRLAEEVLSEVFVIIWKKINHFNFDNPNVYTWLIMLARNKAVDTIRRQRSGVESEPYSDAYEDKYIIPRLNPNTKPIELKDALAMTGRMKRGMEDLTDAQQYVIHLAYFEGLSESEIAAKLNIPVPTVKSKIRVALVSLKENLAKGTFV
ncbi:MAG TPA: sigma-70 family RNA polymerase sigma factor [Ignavibacteriaceae bacterium]|nr:sigma-70 family RNA polymerase sigma factor [Ignavibacteriaceae bacterium]